MALLAIGCLLHVGFFGINSYAVTNSPQGKIKHVIIVVQENRTPDNLFFADNVLVANGGNVRPTGNPPYGLCTIHPEDGSNTYQIPLTGAQLDTCYDTKHLHADWIASYHNGGMDGACYVSLEVPNGCQVPACQTPLPGGRLCPAYSYVSFPISMATYFDIAHKYGFANYFFQNNRGPSYPAHQFLFGGTSLPVPFTQDQTKSKWYAADNPITSAAASCISLSGTKVSLINTDSVWPDCAQHPENSQCIFPCLDHKTMADVLGTNVSWKYYISHSGSLWDAPAAVSSICGADGGECKSHNYTDHVVLANGDHARILNDIKGDGANGCALANVSWVIPDGKWSDHAGRKQNELNINRDGGPSWVGRIVNAVGNSNCTDMINGQPTSYWNDTVILVVWDDWGGWYDHVSPDAPGGPGPGYGQDVLKSGWYVYGFRVPFLVISAYNQHKPGSQGFTGYVSGTPDQNPTCPGKYCHDFGSILNFVEFVFGSNGNYLGTLSDQHSDYADALAADAKPTCATCDYSLSDFFEFDQPAKLFNAIGGMKYPETCFHNPNQANCWPNAPDEDPDDDAYEN